MAELSKPLCPECGEPFPPCRECLRAGPPTCGSPDHFRRFDGEPHVCATCGDGQPHAGFTPTRYTRDDAKPMEFDSVEVELRCRAGEGPHKPPHDWWAVIWRNRTLNRDGEWEYEPLPSSREDDYLDRCRFTLDEALTLARNARTDRPS